MEMQIQDLLTSIRKDGIDAANAQAEEIIKEAKDKAQEIVAKARRDARSEKETAEREIAVLKDSAIISIEQAKRDATLAFKNEIQAAFEKLLNNQVRNTLSGEVLSKLITAVLIGEDVSQYAAEVGVITNELKVELADELRNGLEIRPNKNISSGFRLVSKDGSGFFDCSDEEITQMLMPYFRNLDI